jgi:hypothetical protein
MSIRADGLSVGFWLRDQALPILAIVVAGFVYLEQRNDQRIAAAIQLSHESFSGETSKLRNLYYQQVRMPQAKYDEMLQKRVENQEFDIDMLNGATAYLQYLDYLANLIINKQVNPDYVSDEIKCSIVKSTLLAFPPNPDRSYGLPKQLANVKKFREENPKLDCKPNA